MLLLVTSAVGASLTALAQVNFAVLAVDHGPLSSPAIGRATVVAPFAVATVGDVPRPYLDPLMVVQALLTMEFQLTANALQAVTLLTFEGGLL